MRKHPYTLLLERKRTWTPVQPTKGEIKEGAEETIKRALAIRHMELPVGEFITQGLEGPYRQQRGHFLNRTLKMRSSMISHLATLLNPMGLILNRNWRH